MHKRVWLAILSALLLGVPATPATADLSAFVGYVGFDEEANLDNSPAFGVRWGKSSGIIGGETSLMIARPERDLGPDASAQNATAIFYEGRILLNIPAGDIRPFLNVGFGAITTTSTDVVSSLHDEDPRAVALKAAADLQRKFAFSYGAGVRYAISDRLDLRADVRQYQVFSVTSYAIEKAVEQAIGVDLEEKNTVQYSEMSLGVVIKF